MNLRPVFVIVGWIVSASVPSAAVAQAKAYSVLSQESRECVACHRPTEPGIVQQ